MGAVKSHSPQLKHYAPNQVVGVNLMPRKKKEIGQDNYPMQVWVIAVSNDEPLTFLKREEAFQCAKEMIEDEGEEFMVVGTYTLSGLKKISTKIVEEDI